ncbi:MAG: rhodanese-like domain-containing protein [Halieaceae bacterium]|jgi:rhodanese-related sulfurtransferase|nr:rhodanese-like domain-containing protein [Halieaceae bacterium]
MLARISLIIALFCVLTGAAAWAQFSGLFSGGVPVIDVSELTAALEKPATRDTRSEALGAVAPQAADDSDKPLLPLDVRSEKEIAVSVIPGAITRAEYEADPGRYAAYRLVPYCTVGYRSRQYTETLLDRGVDAVNFEGSIIAWVEAGQPLETLDGERTNRVHTWSSSFTVPDRYEQVYD